VEHLGEDTSGDFLNVKQKDIIYSIVPTVCQFIKKKNVKVPGANFFQHALREREKRSTELKK